MKRRTFLGSLTLLSGCGGGGSPSAPVVSSAPESAVLPVVASDPLLKKLGVFAPNEYETAMVVFNGEPLTITFHHLWGGYADKLTVRRWLTGEVLAEHPWSGGMGCAIVHNGVIHIFGNSNWQNPGNKIIHSTLAPDFTPSTPTDALLMNAPSNPFKFYNTDVCADSNGFRMAVETSVGTYFARSTDLDTWTWGGGQLNAGKYIGCPSIDFIGGAHYLTFLADTGKGWETRTAKSTDDCFTFIYGRTLLTADPSEGVNASDVDMVEFNGKVCGVYMDGDQTTAANLRRWEYKAPLAQMFANYVSS